jgi:hypothetical protein
MVGSPQVYFDNLKGIGKNFKAFSMVTGIQNNLTKHLEHNRCYRNNFPMEGGDKTISN